MLEKELLSIYEDIQKKIQQEKFVSGQRISEMMLMKEYNCSRATIRTVISWCKINNILEVRPKSGTFVKGETNRSFRDKIEVRTYLEKVACRLLIERITNKELDHLYNFLDSMDNELAKIPYSQQILSDLHYDFHYALIKMSKNQCLLSAFQNLNLRYLFSEEARRDVRILFRASEEHREILDCIRAKDVKNCEALLENHLWGQKDIPPTAFKK